MTPNVLFIVLDQLRYDSIGYSAKFTGRKAPLTPNIDSLANEGMFMKNAPTPLFRYALPLVRLCSREFSRIR